MDVWDAQHREAVSSLEGHSGIVIRPGVRCHRRAGGHREPGRQRPDLGSATGRQLVALRLALPVGAQSVAFSPDGRRLVTTWNDGITRIWTLDLDELVDIARDRVTRGLTTVECERYLHVDTCPQS